MTTADNKSLLGLLRPLVLGLAVLVSFPFPALADPGDEPGEDANTKAKDDANVSLLSGAYAELESQYNRYLDLYAARRISEEELASRFEVFDKSLGLESRFDEWVRAYPESYSARLARGIHRVSAAWSKRGSNFARETTDEQLRGFMELLKLAASDFQASIALYSRPVESYRHLIKISMGLGFGGGRGFLDAALKLDPEAYYPRDAYLYAITPRWGGSIRQMEVFVEECRRSALSDKNKSRLEGKHHSYLAQQAWWDKEFITASEHYLKAYRFHNEAKSLYWSGRAAMEGSSKDLAFERFDELIRVHPKYEDGYIQRGFLYETHFKNDEKAFKDYLVAADFGNSWAQNKLGWWYMTGKYVPRDFDRAELYLRRAAAQNNKSAITNLKNLDKLRKKGGNN